MAELTDLDAVVRDRLRNLWHGILPALEGCVRPGSPMPHGSKHGISAAQEMVLVALIHSMDGWARLIGGWASGQARPARRRRLLKPAPTMSRWPPRSRAT